MSALQEQSSAGQQRWDGIPFAHGIPPFCNGYHSIIETYGVEKTAE
jgi:hypothetical protein